MTAMQYTMKDSGVPWIGSVPTNWNVIPARCVCKEVKEKNDDGAETRQLSFRYGKIVDKKQNEATIEAEEETTTAYRVVTPNTIMINGLNLNYDFVSQRVAIVLCKGIITSAYLAIKGNIQQIRPDYNVYLFKGYDSKQIFHSYGSGIRKTLKFSDFKEIPVVLPPLPEQEAIAAYLDEKCGAIDGIIAEAKTTIEEYKAWKASVIFEAVTKGLDPHAEIKDSGVEWIGMVPQNVEVIKLKYLISEYKAGPFGSALITSALLPEGNILVYTPEHIAQKTTKNEKNLYLPENRKEEMEQFFVEPGDIIFPIVGSLGRAMRISPNMPGGIINQRLAKFKIDETRINAEYFMWIFANSTFYSPYIDLYQRGSIIVNLTKSIVCDMPVILPDLSGQKRIVAYLDEKCSAIDGIIAEKQSLIDDLEAYKKSLIFETVTGKRRVC